MISLPSCPCCTEPLKENLCALRCGHVFHKDCVLKWLDLKGKCPNCRKPANFVQDIYFEAKEFTPDPKNVSKLSDSDVKEILEDDEGQLWFGTANGLYQIKEEQNESISFEKVVFKNGIELSDSHIKNILPDYWKGFLDYSDHSDN